MWIGVTQRFSQFHGNLTLTDIQKTDGDTKHRGVRKCLNSHYHGSTSETDNSFLIGSWGKSTHVRPPRDIDIYFVLPVEAYHRFNNYVGNKQSSLLQEVRTVLGRTYPTTKMRGDGQVVVVEFDTMSVEVVPAFKLENGRYWICDTNDGGKYKEADPTAEHSHISSTHTANNNNLRPMVRMLKTWQDWCNVPLKSFHLELLAADFIQQSQWRLQGYFYYDWIMRDFFAYLLRKENSYVFVPGTFEAINIRNSWKSRCDSAYERALKACDYEHDDLIGLAGEEWQKIFGLQVPMRPV